MFRKENNVIKIEDREWVLPSKPIYLPVTFHMITNKVILNEGFYLTTKEAEYLSKNVQALKDYNEKMEFLVLSIQRFYEEKSIKTQTKEIE